MYSLNVLPVAVTTFLVLAASSGDNNVVSALATPTPDSRRAFLNRAAVATTGATMGWVLSTSSAFAGTSCNCGQCAGHSATCACSACQGIHEASCGCSTCQQQQTNNNSHGVGCPCGQCLPKNNRHGAGCGCGACV